MPRIEILTTIRATPERCFDRSLDLDLHLRSMAHTGELAIAGKTSGLIGLGEEVTWRGRHFGLYHEHTSRITRFDRPRHFRDEMIRGRFKRFVHDHYFEAISTGTQMRDVLDFTSPWGPLGWLVDRAVLAGYLRRLLQERNGIVREAAEAGVDSEGTAVHA